MRAMALLMLAACGRIDFDPLTDAAAGSNAGPVAFWKLDDGAGTLAIDSSGQDNTGTLTAGVTWTIGQINGAAAFDGVADHDIDLGDPVVLRLSGSMTLAAWVNASSFRLGDSSDDAIVARDDFHNTGVGWALKGTEDCGQEHFAVQIGTGGITSVTRCSNLVPSTSIWYHVAGVYDAGAQVMHIYIDGSQDDGMLFTDPGPVPSSQFVPTTNAQIANDDPGGGKVTGGSNSFHGLLDDVRVYNRALDAEEIAALAM